MARTERDLLGLREKIVRIAIEDHLSHHLQRDELLRNYFSGVEHVELEFVSGILIKNLQSQFPLGGVATVNCFPQVPAMEIGVRTINFHGFIPHHGTISELRTPVPFDEVGLA